MNYYHIDDNKDTSWVGMVAHACNPSWEAETGGSQVQGQPQQLREARSNLVRPCFKIETNNRWVWWSQLIIPVLGRLKQEDYRFKASLSNLVRLSAI